jgi:hypothetical protein
MSLYDEPELLLQTIHDFLSDRPEWQSHVPVTEEGHPCLSPPVFYGFVVWAEYQGLITGGEAEGWLQATGERLAFLEEAHRRIDAVDPD